MSASVTMSQRPRSTGETIMLGAAGLVALALLGAAGVGLELRGAPRSAAPTVVATQAPHESLSAQTPGDSAALNGAVPDSGSSSSIIMTTGMATTTGAWTGSVASPAPVAPLLADQAAPVPLKRPVPSVQSFAFDERGLAEYRAVATEVGAVPAELTIADFRAFLAAHKIPTYDLGNVVSYMDKIAATDNPDRLGWHWAPVRANDFRDIHLGRESAGSVSCVGGCFVGSGMINQVDGHWVNATYSARVPASDYYDAGKQPYARTIPLHALQLIATIEHAFGAGKVAFMISDYTTYPDRIVTPDPFLMAVIPNDKLAKGDGRFIIDAWDEPGFGVGPKDSEVTAP